MKSIGSIFAALFLASVLVLYMCSYQVRFTEVAIKKTWGKADPAPVVEPGLYFKWPRPIQDVVRYDKRVRILDDKTEETRTADGENLILTTYALWKIADPARFQTNFPGGVESGEAKLRGTIRNHKQSVTGRRKLSDFISTNPQERKLAEIERELLALVNDDATKQYGIEVVNLGIKKLGLPETVTMAIFEKMKSNQESLAARYNAEGEAAARDIVARAEAASERILAAAREEVVKIENEAQRTVGEYYKEFDRHPELRIFLDKLDTFTESLMMRTTIILDASQPPYDLFNPEAREAVTPQSPAPKGSQSKSADEVKPATVKTGLDG